MDPDLERYLNERGIPYRALEEVGAEYRDGSIRWPRYSIDLSQVLGWKCRDLESGRFYGDPSGIPHSGTAPLIACRSFPSNTGAMICEGESDTMRLACTSLPATYNSDVICIPGATAFPAEWVPLLRGYDRVAVFADSDDAGMALPNRLASLVPGVRRVVLPAGHDVCSFLQGVGAEEDLRSLYQIAPLHVAPPAKLRVMNLQWDDAASSDYRDKLTRIICEDVTLHRRGNEMMGLCPFH
mgnify:CR=1 FL=1